MPAKDLPDSGVLSGWSMLRRRLNPMSAPPDVPTIVELIMRSAESGNIVTQSTGTGADVTFRPPVAEYALMEFEAYAELIETGYQHAIERLAISRAKLAI